MASSRDRAVSTVQRSRLIGPVTFDARTLKTNYNVLDNSTYAKELWLRTGFEWALANNVTLKNQSYYYQAKRYWLDNETYAFNSPRPPNSDESIATVSSSVTSRI